MRAGLERLHREIAERDIAPALRDAAVVALLRLADTWCASGKASSSNAPAICGAALALQHLALEDPHLDADDPVLGAGLGEAELDVGAQRVQRNAAFAVRLDAAHLAAAEAAGAADADALGAELHRGRERLLHGAAEGDAALELRRDVLGDELRVRLGLAHLLNVDEDLVLRERLDAREERLALGGGLQVADLQRLDALAALADDHAGPRREDDDLALVGGALDLDAGDVRVLEVVLDRALDADVLVEPLLRSSCPRTTCCSTS